jgi:hypothetical protein
MHRPHHSQSSPPLATTPKEAHARLAAGTGARGLSAKPAQIWTRHSSASPATADRTTGPAATFTEATAARDDLLSVLTNARAADRPATVVGAYNVRTGSVGVGWSSKILQECAEACAARNIGGDPADIRFTRAFRPNGVGAPFKEVPVCESYCEPAYGRGASPDPLTIFESDLH